MRNKGKNKGITLIALVITIIVLIILAGVSIGMTTGDNGIITQTLNAKKMTIIEEIREKIKIDILNERFNHEKIDYAILISILEKYGTIEYDNDKIKGIVTPEGYEILLSDLVDKLNYGIPLAYLECNGDQYIITHIIPSEFTKAEIKFTFNSISTTKNQFVLASRENLSINNFSVGVGWQGTSFGIGRGSYSLQTRIVPQTNTEYIVKVSRDEFSINDVINTTSVTEWRGDAKNPLVIGGIMENGQIRLDEKHNGKIYYCKIYEKEQLIFDGIPVLDQNNKPCLLDTVTGTYYYNQGTSEDFHYQIIK